MTNSQPAHFADFVVVWGSRWTYTGFWTCVGKEGTAGIVHVTLPKVSYSFCAEFCCELEGKIVLKSILKLTRARGFAWLFAYISMYSDMHTYKFSVKWRRNTERVFRIPFNTIYPTKGKRRRVLWFQIVRGYAYVTRRFTLMVSQRTD